MNKSELIAEISDLTGLTKVDCNRVIDAFQQSVMTALKGGDEVVLVGFCKFYAVRRKKTEGRNPKTGKPIVIPASNQPKIKAGKLLKDAIN